MFSTYIFLENYTSPVCPSVHGETALWALRGTVAVYRAKQYKGTVKVCN